MTDTSTAAIFNILLTRDPIAYAQISGVDDNTNPQGFVLFFPIWDGTLVLADITGLPTDEAACTPDFYGFHVHNEGAHYNPGSCPHPAHAGDLPPLLGNHGFAWQMFYTDRFHPEEIAGMMVVIHKNSDDFTTQPSGNSGAFLATGEIKRYV